jgi:hypothetical protein
MCYWCLLKSLWDGFLDLTHAWRSEIMFECKREGERERVSGTKGRANPTVGFKLITIRETTLIHLCIGYMLYIKDLLIFFCLNYWRRLSLKDYNHFNPTSSRSSFGSSIWRVPIVGYSLCLWGACYFAT